jgi:hypothetical protein
MTFKTLIGENWADMKIKTDSIGQPIDAAFGKAGANNNNHRYYQDKQCWQFPFHDQPAESYKNSGGHAGGPVILNVE